MVKSTYQAAEGAASHSNPRPPSADHRLRVSRKAAAVSRIVTGSDPPWGERGARRGAPLPSSLVVLRLELLAEVGARGAGLAEELARNRRAPIGPLGQVRIGQQHVGGVV